MSIYIYLQMCKQDRGTERDDGGKRIDRPERLQHKNGMAQVRCA